MIDWRKFVPVLLLGIVFIIAGGRLATGGEQRELSYSLAPAAFEAQMSSGQFALPQFRVYDREGRQVLDLGEGFNAEEFERRLVSALTAPSPTGQERTLRAELDELVGADGRPAESLPPADFSIVEYWAEWCAPCKEQAAAIAQVLARHPGPTVNLLHVEADPKKLSASLGDAAVISIDASEIGPELLALLNDPRVSQEEKRKLLEKLAAQGAAEDAKTPGE